MQDFVQRYQEFPNKEILKIVLRPQEYQAEAVQAAEEVLATRTVDPTDYETAVRELEERDHRMARGSAWANKAIDETNRGLTYLFAPSETFEARKWVYLACIGLSIAYVLTSISRVQHLWSILGCRDCPMTVYEIGLIVMLLYAPAEITLLLLRNKWGWRILLFDACCTILIQLFFTIFTWHTHLFPVAAQLLQVAMYIGIARLLYRDDVITLFQEQKSNYRTTLLAGLAASIGFIIFVVMSA